MLYRFKTAIISTLLLTCGLLSTGVQANFIEADWVNPGDNKAVLDTATQLEWLDLDITQNISYNQVVTELSTTYSGWRLPTGIEVDNLFTSFFNGMPTPISGYSDYNNGPFKTLALTFKALFQTNLPFDGFIYGMYNRSSQAGGVITMAGVQVSGAVTRIFNTNWGQPYNPTTPTYLNSTYLVRSIAPTTPSGTTTSTPVPIEGVVFSLFLFGATNLLRKKKAKQVKLFT